jgi:UDP-glucose 4-epimerase
MEARETDLSGLQIGLVGGSGFLGSALTTSLSNAGAKCTIIDPKEPTTKFEGKWHRPPHSEEGWRKIISGINVCVYLHSSSIPQSSYNQPILELELNERPLLNLLPILLENQVQLIYFSSGGAIYGEIKQGQAKENHPLSPKSPYGVGKQISEAWIRWYQNQGLKALIVRPSTIYGIGQGLRPGQGVIYAMLKSAYLNLEFELQGGGQPIKDFLYLDDLVDFVHIALRQRATGTFNVGSGIARSLKAVLHAVEETIGKKIRCKEVEVHPSDVQRMCLDASKAVGLGWGPTTSLEKGIRSIWEELKNTK